MTTLALTVLFSITSSMKVIEMNVGKGPVVQRGDRYTLTFKLDVIGGKELANSDKRGLAFSKELGDGHDGYFDKWVEGMSVGAKREILFGANQMPDALRFSVPAKTDVMVTLRLVGLKKKPSE